MSNFVDKLDKKRPAPQTVEGEVEFLSDITVPSSSVILGKDGARVGSSARALSYTDARERNTLFAQYNYDDTGGTVLTYWDIAERNTVNVCPDFGVTLSDPQELPFSGAAGNTLTRAFRIIPKTAGTLRVQSWEGADDTGAVLVDNEFEILVGDIDNVTMIQIPLGQISEIGDMQFTRFSGVQLAGSLSQSGGLFVGQECPYLDSDIHLLTSKKITTTLETILIADSFADQSPSSTDTPLQIEFGAAQNGSSDPVQISSTGVLTFNENYIANISIDAEYGRAGSPQVSEIRFRILINGTPVEPVLSAKITSADIRIPLVVSTEITVVEGMTLAFEILRDSSGHNSGGLFSSTTALAGWGDSPSARLVIKRYI